MSKNQSVWMAAVYSFQAAWFFVYMHIILDYYRYYILHLAWFCAALSSDCWTETADVHGSGGVSRGLTTLDECQAACISDDECIAVDWEPGHRETTCWTLTTTRTRKTSVTGVITHYELNRDCLGKPYNYLTIRYDTIILLKNTTNVCK